MYKLFTGRKNNTLIRSTAVLQGANQFFSDSNNNNNNNKCNVVRHVMKEQESPFLL